MRSRTALRYSRCSTGPRFLSVRYVPRSGAKKLGCRVVDEIGYPVFEKASSRKLFGRPEWAALWDLTSQQNGREATLLPPLRPAKVRDPEPSSHLPDVPEPSSGNAPSAHSGEWGGRTDWPGICRPIAPFRRCRGGAPAPWAPRGGAPGRSGRAGSPGARAEGLPEAGVERPRARADRQGRAARGVRAGGAARPRVPDHAEEPGVIGPCLPFGWIARTEP